MKLLKFYAIAFTFFIACAAAFAQENGTADTETKIKQNDTISVQLTPLDTLTVIVENKKGHQYLNVPIDTNKWQKLFGAKPMASSDAGQLPITNILTIALLSAILSLVIIIFRRIQNTKNDPPAGEKTAMSNGSNALQPNELITRIKKPYKEFYEAAENAMNLDELKKVFNNHNMKNSTIFEFRETQSVTGIKNAKSVAQLILHLQSLNNPCADAIGKLQKTHEITEIRTPPDLIGFLTEIGNQPMKQEIEKLIASAEKMKLKDVAFATLITNVNALNANRNKIEIAIGQINDADWRKQFNDLVNLIAANIIESKMKEFPKNLYREYSGFISDLSTYNIDNDRNNASFLKKSIELSVFCMDYISFTADPNRMTLYSGRIANNIVMINENKESVKMFNKDKDQDYNFGKNPMPGKLEFYSRFCVKNNIEDLNVFIDGDPIQYDLVKNSIPK